MSPQAQETIIQVIREVNTKVLAETKEEGIEEGREEKQLEIAQNLKKTMDDEEIAKVTGLTLERIRNLK